VLTLYGEQRFPITEDIQYMKKNILIAYLF